ncbi:MAG TPA: hypothetical protein VL022_09985 [Moheibacter sp.]|nr:hypothetical protein [Moheibacter sp.]
MHAIVQYIFIGIVFLVAVFYVAKMVKDAIRTRNAPAKSCDNCSDDLPNSKEISTKKDD